MVYLDSGMIIKLYVEEPDSQDWRQRLGSQSDLLTSVLSLPEMRSALRQKVQLGLLRATVAREVWAELQTIIANDAITAVPFGREVVDECLEIYEQLPRRLALRTLDALHLATARRLKSSVVAT